MAKICSSSDVPTLGPAGNRTEEANSKKVAVFEGFIDFLSLLSYNEKDIPGHDCCILNSVSNLERALPWIAHHKEIMVFADNDNAGRETLQKITDFVSGSSEEVSIYDMAELYKGHKDVNDKLVEEMTETNPSSGSDIKKPPISGMRGRLNLTIPRRCYFRFQDSLYSHQTKDIRSLLF